MAQANLIERTHLDYDQESDTFYINFNPPQAADDSDLTDEGIIVRLREGHIVGLTILNASKVVI